MTFDDSVHALTYSSITEQRQTACKSCPPLLLRIYLHPWQKLCRSNHKEHHSNRVDKRPREIIQTAIIKLAINWNYLITVNETFRPVY